MVTLLSKTRKTRKRCETTDIPYYDKDIVATIDISAIKHNLQFLSAKCGTELMPILKADAYGHGLLGMAKVLRKLGIKFIGVATLGEAILLRKNGDKGRILGWLYNIDGPELVEAFKLDIDVAICDDQIIPKFISLIPKGKIIRVTIFTDTGINRAGIPLELTVKACVEVNKCPKIELVGLMSHLVCSGVKNSPIVLGQLTKFRKLRTDLEAIGIRPPLVHIANTGGCMNYDVSDFTLARPGSGLYGITADFKRNKHLKLPMTIQTRIIQTKYVGKGEGIGYDWQYITPRRMKVAILPIGYADIIPRDTSMLLYVYINGTRRKALGRISMDQIVVEAEENDSINDIAYIFGNGTNCKQTIYDISKMAKMIPLEILCHTGNRINLNYVLQQTR